ncbi:putative ankyrin repeat protein RF_0381 [Patella vulgata]|uniref:putative ankyrin repeat protein RF_0381 n=1 Tax=Patella vulgata TaxID=6465 RepID=UPI0024A9B09D|nr:putative ankyrin repeat protein RF_0381 [Patella vulgata]
MPVFTATRKGLYEVVIYMLEHGFDVHYVDSLQNNLIHILLYRYDRYDNKGRHALLLPCVVKLVDAGVDVNQLNVDKMTPLLIAARKGLCDVVIYLLEHGVDVHCLDGRQNNLMNIVLYNYDRSYNTGRIDLLLSCVVKLVDAGVDAKQSDEDKVTTIFIAARKGLNDIVMYFLKRGVDAHCVDSCKCNILHYILCCMYSSVMDEEKCIQLVNTLINMGSSINQPDHEGNTPLFYVCINKPKFCMSNMHGIKLALEAGQDIYVRLKCKLINILLEAGCNVNHQNTEGQTALMYYIIQQSDTSILKLLIPHSDLSLSDNNGDTAISYCVQYHMFRSTAVFKLLVDSGSNLMSRSHRVKLLYNILNCKRLGVFSYYIRLKLIVNGVTADGANMLHLLARVNYNYSLNKFKLLLHNELDINQLCSKTNSPTMIAAFLLNSKYLELLTRHPRLDINAQNNQGHTAVHLCVIGFTMFKDGLNKRQVNDVVKNYCRQIYPIYMACIDSLLGVDGIDVNIKDHRGRTSLMMAAMKNDRVLTRKLLRAGAIVNLLDYSGRTALQYLNIYQSVFDLTCFKLLLSNGNTGLLNLPCIDGNKIIQTVLCFPRLWEPCQTICFIRYLVSANCCLQILVTASFESNYNQIDLIELSPQERDKLRQLLYLSGAQGEQIMTSLNFDQEDKQYQENDTIRSRDREKFISFCSNVSLKSICRRFIRQNLGWEIKEKIKDLELPR